MQRVLLIAFLFTFPCTAFAQGQDEASRLKQSVAKAYELSKAGPKLPVASNLTQFDYNYEFRYTDAGKSADSAACTPSRGPMITAFANENLWIGLQKAPKTQARNQPGFRQRGTTVLRYKIPKRRR